MEEIQYLRFIFVPVKVKWCIIFTLVNTHFQTRKHECKLTCENNTMINCRSCFL